MYLNPSNGHLLGSIWSIRSIPLFSYCALHNHQDHSCDILMNTCLWKLENLGEIYNRNVQMFAFCPMTVSTPFFFQVTAKFIKSKTF